MKTCQITDLLIHKAKLAGLLVLLCLPLYSSAMQLMRQSKDQPMAEEITDTDYQPPEGFHPLPVTEFMVEAEKDDTYMISVAVEVDDATSALSKVIYDHVRGQLKIYYSPHSYAKSFPLIRKYPIFIPYNPDDYRPGHRAPDVPVGSFHVSYLHRTYKGDFYALKLKRGDYIIVTDLYFPDNISIKNPHVIIHFVREKRDFW